MNRTFPFTWYGKLTFRILLFSCLIITTLKDKLLLDYQIIPIHSSFIQLSDALLHKFYLSVTQIQQTQNSLQVISNVFWDDLEIELSDYYQKKIFITDPDIQDYIQNYFKEYFLLYQNGKKLSFQWVGMEITVDKAEIYFEYLNVSNTHHLSLNNRILFRKFPEQKNMTHLITIDKKRYTLLHKTEDGIKSWR